MEIEIIALCDFAQVVNDKLTIIGTFEAIGGPVFPLTQTVSIGCKLRCSEEEIKEHDLKITATNNQGENIIPPIEGKLSVPKPNYGKPNVNFSVTMNQVVFKEPGDYLITFYINNKVLKALTLTLVKL
jgi:hypothetical protein